MSRLKKKLLLYFILISIVSVSVSAEIILELGSPTFKNEFLSQVEKQISKEFTPEQSKDFIDNKLNKNDFFFPILDLQVRMILLLLVVTSSIVGAFFLFTKEIVSPLEGMVAATKKIADGDLSATVPVLSQDEIGQIGNLINDMSINLQEMIIQIRSEVMRLREKITRANDRVTRALHTEELKKGIKEKRIRMSNLNEIIDAGDEVSTILDDMVIELSSLQAFVNMYKVFQVSDESEEQKKTLIEMKDENIHDINM